MKKVLLCILCFCASILNAQITIMDEDVQERIVLKPKAFDSLANITYQKDPIQYKKYIGYKLYSLPISNKNTNVKSKNIIRSPWDSFRCKLPHEFVIPHDRVSPRYEKNFIVSTDIYNATTDVKVNHWEDIHPENQIYTPYESIQNTYFTILNIEIADMLGHFSALEEWDNGKYSSTTKLRFTLKNETTGEELYWITINEPVSMYKRDLHCPFMFLVPYFEKMQKTYKGQKVVPTTDLKNLADISTGEPINIQSSEVWQCYDVTFVNLKDEIFIQPYFFLEKDGSKVKVSFQDFTEKCNGIFTEKDYVYRPTFMLEQDFNEIVAERKRAIDEQQRIKEERQRIEEFARQERNKQIMQKYGKKYGSLICEGKVCLNMTKEMCIAAWGEPIYVNSSIVKGLVVEQWVYGWRTYLYFDNNVLTAIQN